MYGTALVLSMYESLSQKNSIVILINYCVIQNVTTEISRMNREGSEAKLLDYFYYL